VISALAVSPVRQRVRLFWRPQRTNIRAPDAADFVRQLLAHLQGTVFLLWDNASIHKGPVLADLQRRFPRLRLVSLPPYAPNSTWTRASGATPSVRSPTHHPTTSRPCTKRWRRRSTGWPGVPQC
jgi:hypothetical protein